MSEQNPERTGGERVIRNDLQDVDKEVNQQISDRPLGKNRQEKRRGIFIDAYGDEDNNPDTDEGKYRRKQQEQQGR